MVHPDVKIEKIEVTDYFPLKHSSKKWYITIPPQLIRIHDLMVGDFLKITLLEAKRIRTEEDAQDHET